MIIESLGSPEDHPRWHSSFEHALFAVEILHSRLSMAICMRPGMSSFVTGSMGSFFAFIIFCLQAKQEDHRFLFLS